ncbi:MAG: DNA-processing protein DprA [Clostridia bacterium]|nr:DNA-processing protein DprA [Clostridia bacterium]
MISEVDRFLVFMSMQEISNKKQEMLLDELESFSISKILENKEGILSKDEVLKLAKNHDSRALDSAIENMQKSGIQIITIFSEKYPKSLADLPEKPLILYAKGDLSLLDETCIGIVGTRMPSNYGKLVTEKFAKKLAESGFVIVSGLCYGVDEIAHKGHLRLEGKLLPSLAAVSITYIQPQTALSQKKLLTRVCFCPNIHHLLLQRNTPFLAEIELLQGYVRAF